MRKFCGKKGTQIRHPVEAQIYGDQLANQWRQATGILWPAAQPHHPDDVAMARNAKCRLTTSLLRSISAFSLHNRRWGDFPKDSGMVTQAALNLFSLILLFLLYQPPGPTYSRPSKTQRLFHLAPQEMLSPAKKHFCPGLVVCWNYAAWISSAATCCCSKYNTKVDTAPKALEEN